MLDILGTIAGDILSLPGILGLALGMTTRQLPVGCALGALVGIVSTYIFADMSFLNAGMTELVIALIVGTLAGGVGSLIRRRGATV